MKKKRAQVTRKRTQVTKKRTPTRKKRGKAKSRSASPFNFPNLNKKVVTLLSFVIIPLLLVLVGRSWIQNPQNLTIKVVDVQGGLKHLDRAVLEPIIAPFVKTNLFLLDKEGLEEEIEFNHWVYSASLVSIWPNKLIIKIHEQQPIAFWGKEGMVNEFGEVIDVDLPLQRSELPTLYSPFDKGREMVENYVKIRQWMKDFPVDIIEFTEDRRGSWQLKLSNGIQVNIGRHEHERRLRRFLVGYNQRLASQVKKIDTVDLRYTNGFSVKWI